MAEYKDSYTLEALITGDNSRLKRAIEMAKKMLDSLEKKGADDIEIDANLSPLQRKVSLAKRYIGELNEKRADVEIDADTDDFSRKMKLVRTQMKLLQTKEAQIKIIAQNKEALAKIGAVRLSAKKLSAEKPKIKIDVEDKAALAKTNRFKLMLKSIPNRVRTRLVVENKGLNTAIKAWNSLNKHADRYTATMDRVAVTIRSFGTVIGHQVLGFMIASFSALVPIIASLVPAIMAVGNALGVLIGQTWGLVGAVGILAGGMVSFGAVAVSAWSMYKDGAIEANKHTEAVENALDKFTGTWEKLVKNNANSIFKSMANGINFATVALKALTPFIEGSIKTMEWASKGMLDWAKNSNVAKKFFSSMGTTGVDIFGNMLAGLGKFGDGFINMFTQFMPLFSHVSAGFEDMGQRFSDFMKSTKAQDGIKGFTEYIKNNMPLISKIFGDTFKGLINLFKAFSANSTVIFEALGKLTGRFREWSATVSESDGFQKFIDYVQRNGPTIMSLIGNIVMLLVNFGIAIAPLGEKVLQFTNGAIEMASALFEAHPALGLVIGGLVTLLGWIFMVLPNLLALRDFVLPVIDSFILWARHLGLLEKALYLVKTPLTKLPALFGLISAPVLAVIAVLTGLVVAFIMVYNRSEWLRETLATAWETIKTTAIEAWNALKDAVMSAVDAVVTFVMDIYGRLLTWWEENNELYYQTIELVWGKIVAFIEPVLQVLATMITSAWNKLVMVTQVLWETFKTVIMVVWEVIKVVVQVAIEFVLGIITTVMAIINGDWALAWETIKTTASTIWQMIVESASRIFTILKEFLVNVWNIIKEYVVETVQKMKDGAVEKWEFLKNRFVAISNLLKAYVSHKFQELKAAVVQKILELVAKGVQKFEELKAKVVNAVQVLKTLAVAKFAELTTNAINKVNQLKTSAVNKFNELKTNVVNKAQEIKTSVTNKITEMKQAVINKFSELKTSAVNKIVEMKNAIANKASEFVQIGRDLIQGLINGVTQMAGRLIESTKGVVQGAINGAKSLLGIHSPSRVFKSIGQYTMEGMTIGINREGRSTIKSTVDMAKRVSQAFAPNLDAGMMTLGADIAKASQNLATQVNANVTSNINAQPQQVTITNNLTLGKRDYRNFVGDVSEEQKRESNLEEVYNV